MAKQNRKIAHIDLSQEDQVTRPKAGKKNQQKNKQKSKQPLKGARRG